jgi:voltage-gated potassium channel
MPAPPLHGTPFPASHPVACRAVRRVELGALLGTIPAFYVATLSVQRAVAVTLYLVAFAACMAALWRELAPGRGRRADDAVPTGPTGTRVGSRRRRLDTGLLLGAALLLSAVLPAGDAESVLVVRLGAAALTVLRLGESLQPWFWRRGLPNLLALAIGVFGLCGLGFWWLEPRVLSFGDGLWLAFTTAATIGYGDIVPSTPAARIFAVFVVLMGVALLSVVTASIAAMWIQSEERRIEQEVLREVHAELQSVREALGALRRDPVVCGRGRHASPAVMVHPLDAKHRVMDARAPRSPGTRCCRRQAWTGSRRRRRLPHRTDAAGA